MEDRPGQRGAAGLGDELAGPPGPAVGSRPRMKRFSENGARPVRALGGLNTPPFGRLGALVFQPHNSEPLYWASLSGSDPDSRMCVGPLPHGHPLGKRFPRKALRQAGLIALAQGGRRAPPGRLAKWRLRRRKHDQFFALGRGCGAHPRNSRQQRRLLPGADASAIHGRTERSGCTAAEPYPLSRSAQTTASTTPCQANKNNELKNHSKGLTAILIAGSQSPGYQQALGWLWGGFGWLWPADKDHSQY